MSLVAFTRHRGGSAGRNGPSGSIRLLRPTQVNVLPLGPHLKLAAATCAFDAKTSLSRDNSMPKAHPGVEDALKAVHAPGHSQRHIPPAHPKLLVNAAQVRFSRVRRDKQFIGRGRNRGALF